MCAEPAARPELTPQTVVSRFLTEDGQFSRAHGKAKPRAFEPHRIDLETSTLEIDGLAVDEIWRIGDDVVGSAHGKAVLARADLTVEQASFEVLYALRTPPPPRHVSIRGWPKDDKGLRISLRQVLAARANLTIRPS